MSARATPFGLARAGFLFTEPPGMAGLPFDQSSEFMTRRVGW
jgi:hypothetical protein